jgi:septal ring factor EnvC (AmiA/AmiB activator)
VGQRKQLWMLLPVFVGMGLFAGLTMWQISQFQQKDRDIARVKTELEQTKQQMQLLQENNKATIVARGKLQKDLAAVKKQATTFQQQGLAIEKQLKEAQVQLKTAQDIANKLNAENINLKTQLEAALKTPKPEGGAAKSPSKATTTPNFLNTPLR